jgi:outer membrane protein TolC
MASSQTPPPVAGGLTIDLQQAIARARQYAGPLQSANLTVAQATQDRVQARAAKFPQISGLSQYIHTEDNGSPTGVFVANNGVHVFTDQALVHQEVLPLVRHGEEQRALAAEAVARARVDVAARGLNAVVIQNYYVIAAAMRRLDNATLGLTEARQFVDITQKQETGGEAAHADVIKAQSQLQQREIDLSEAQTNLDKAKIALAVLIFPDFQTDFSIKDDLDQADVIPALPDARAQAVASNPDVKAAFAVVDQTGYDVNIARYGYWPTIGLDFFYGLNANELKLHNADGQRNIGNAAQITVDIPIWNWGTTKSKVKQAELRQEQARLDLSTTQRALQAAIAAAHREADGALSQVTFLRESENYATQSLRLTVLRYEAGESTAFEVADAQSTVKQARDAYDDGLARYRAALANLRTLMGTL